MSDFIDLLWPPYLLTMLVALILVCETGCREIGCEPNKPEKNILAEELRVDIVYNRNLGFRSKSYRSLNSASIIDAVFCFRFCLFCFCWCLFDCVFCLFFCCCLVSFIVSSFLFFSMYVQIYIEMYEFL